MAISSLLHRLVPDHLVENVNHLRDEFVITIVMKTPGNGLTLASTGFVTQNPKNVISYHSVTAQVLRCPYLAVDAAPELGSAIFCQIFKGFIIGSEL